MPVDGQRSTSCFVLDADMGVWLKERRKRLQVDSISLVVRQILRAEMERERQAAQVRQFEAVG